MCVYVCVYVCSSTMGQVYSEHRDDDGFLYVAYSGENTFGSLSMTWRQQLTDDDDDDDV